MNRAAYRLLTCPKRLVFVPGASHLFEEPDTLEKVAEHALTWFQQYFCPASKAQAHKQRSVLDENNTRG
ncbi:MAG TPA: hypothetical protein VN638_05455 [Nitrospiraceae bacterium]|nr:hypothetical protein [Nitrospiraceae bacterium]